MNETVPPPAGEKLDAIVFTLNGQTTNAPDPSRRLSETLREQCGARDVKVGCNAGDCGACTVLLDGEPVCACITATARAAGHAIETLSGLHDHDPIAGKIASAFLKHGAAQCGICTPGMIVTATSLLRSGVPLDVSVVEDALGGVLCRCTGYRKIIDAVLEAAGAAVISPSGDVSGHIGASITRLDGVPKVSGREIFGDDAAPDDALIVRVIRSPHPHAAFTFGDLETYKARYPGIDLILIAKDIPGRNCFGVIAPFADQPAFAEGAARYRGEAVAAVVGSREVIEALDLSAFPISWEKLPAVLSVPDALKEDAPQIHAGRAQNIMCGGLVQKGDLDKGFASAAVISEARFSTGFVEHAYIEPEAGYAIRKGDVLEIRASTQAPYMDRDSMAEIMALPAEQIRIVPTACGGGFGSKLDISMQPYVGLAAWILKKPVRIAYSRTESMQSTTKRHPSDITLRIGADRDGKITAFDFHGDFNTGAYASWGPTVANRVPVHASGPYFIENYRARSRAIHTHLPPAGAFRGFGVPQSAFAQESILDDIALQLGLDRLAIRRLNVLKNGEPTVTGQMFEKGVGIGQCLDALAPHWDRALAEADAVNAASGVKRRGVGIASGWYGCGNTSLPNPSTIRAGFKADGALVLHQGATDIGQGANTVITQIFATALGLPVDAITRLGPDTAITPDAGKTSASRQTFVTGNAARLAGEALRAEILRLANCSDAAAIAISGAHLIVSEGVASRTIDLASLTSNDLGYVLFAEKTYDPPTKALDANGQGEPYAVYGYAAHLVELEVDIELGTVKLLKFTAAHDVGKAINPVLVEGQVHGGIAQGLGMALMEDYIPGVTENLHDYLIPGFGDVPEIETLIVEDEDMHGPYGAKGLGEHVLIPTAPAIVNAIRHATGARIFDLPATPTRILTAMGKIGR